MNQKKSQQSYERLKNNLELGGGEKKEVKEVRKEVRKTEVE